MRLSESLRKNIMETTAGRLLNKFKIRSRRDVLFFEDILANYIKECEEAGYEEEMKSIAQKWMNLGVKQVVPRIFKRSPIFFLNNVMKKVWINLGLMEELNVTKNKNIIRIEVKNEVPTRIIGKNNFMIGFYTGILNILFNSYLECFKASQTKEHCNYFFIVEDRPFNVFNCKEKKDYNQKNRLLNIKGFTLKDALKKRIFQIKGNNKLYFRGKAIIPGENTLSHLISNSNLLLERIPYISYNYFKKIIKENSSDEEKLLLIKTLLQVMGWGIVKIIKNRKKIYIEINNPPYGLQIERDNWNFIIKTILGYIWLLDRNFKVENINEKYEKLSIIYSN